MPRPRRRRHVHIDPLVTGFSPRGFGSKNPDKIILHTEELEAIRLVDFAELEQRDAAKKMKVPTTTFQRTLYSARKKIADALIYGKIIEIQKREEVINMPGGDALPAGRQGTGPTGQGPVGPGRGAGRGRQPGGYGLGPGGDCICPSCNTKAPHQRGVPCYQIECPKCGAKMIRANN